jgi:hypothetical protein
MLRAVHNEWERREALLAIGEDGFAWPSTHADIGSGNLETGGWLREGMLKIMGYVVGDANGKGRDERQRLLSVIFDGPLPPVLPWAHMAEWSRPGMPGRLKKLAECIAAFVRNAKRRRDADMRSAIEDWEDDLDFLFHRYYRGRFNFDWPETLV